MKYAAILILAFLLAGCMSDDHPFQTFDTFVPADIDDGWEISTPAQENMDSQALAEIYSDVHGDSSLWQMRSLLVFRNNKLVAESYLKDDQDITRPRALWSCTKQVLAVLVGQAIEQGVLQSINDPISLYLPDEIQSHPEKADITIENLLTMMS